MGRIDGSLSCQATEDRAPASWYPHEEPCALNHGNHVRKNLTRIIPHQGVEFQSFPEKSRNSHEDAAGRGGGEGRTSARVGPLAKEASDGLGGPQRAEPEGEVGERFG